MAAKTGETREALISEETAKLAKKKGFKFAYREDDPDEYGDGQHSYVKRRSNGEMVAMSHYYLDTNGNCQQYDYGKKDSYPAPTQSLLAKWLRDVHKIHVYANSCFFKNDDGKFEVKFNGVIKSLSDAYAGYDNVFTFGTYEESMEAVLFNALKMVSK